jgi:hypothetical protein
VADVEPVEKLTEDGMFRVLLLDDKVALAPLLGATVDSVTVQLALPFVVRVDGVHWREVTWIPVTTEPPVDVTGIAAAIEEAPWASVIPIVLVPLAADIVRDNVATVPL